MSFGALSAYLAGDHDRLSALLQQAVANPEQIDAEAYAGFRTGLLRHIGMEEKILFPATQRLIQREEVTTVIAQLHLDHAALTAMLVPPPSPELVRTIQSLLDQHNVLEEGTGGLYDLCEQAAGQELGTLVAQLRATPEVPVRSYVESPLVRHQIELLLESAQAARHALNDR